MRAISQKESILFQDAQTNPALVNADSVIRGAMSSIICAVIRSPEKTFGILHLDRGPHQSPFTEADLYLADSLAAALAVGLERIQMLEKQQESFENCPIGIYRTTPDGQVMAVNAAAMKMIGCRSADEFALRETDITEPVPCDFSGRPSSAEYSWQRNDGAFVTIREKMRAVRDTNGKVVYFEATLEDISEQRWIEEQLRERESFLRNLIDHIPCGIFWKDRDSVYTGCNKQFALDQGLGSSASIII